MSLYIMTFTSFTLDMYISLYGVRM